MATSKQVTLVEGLEAFTPRIGVDAVIYCDAEGNVYRVSPQGGPSDKVCPACGFLSVDEAACPVDGTATEQRANIVENAAETAVLQSADVLVLEDRPDLGPQGGIAALLRF